MSSPAWTSLFARRSLLTQLAIASLWSSTVHVHAFNMAASTNLAVYWGTDSYGNTHPSDTANFQQRLSYYCGSGSVIDTFPIAFLGVAFDTGGLPSIDLANTCGPSASGGPTPVFSGTNMPNCQFLQPDIEQCQSEGKIVTISIGGGAGDVSFSSTAQAQAFAETIWNLFLGGSSPDRPFGSAVLDGVDLDIEGGNPDYFGAFVTQLRTYFNGASKQYYVTAAPQCPYPDAYIGTALNSADFDAVYVQFYNNYCQLTSYSNPNDFDFATWDNWAKTVSPNKNVKVYLGAAASSTAAGSGYVDAGTITTIISQVKSTYSSFGGVMLWDASQAYVNDRYDVTCKDALTGSSAPPPPPPSSSPTTTTTSTTRTTTTSTSTSHTTSSSPPPSGGSCAGVAAWSSTVAYTGGEQVTYDGDLWTAKWWSEADVPGGSAGDWTNDGPCTNAAAVAAVAQNQVLAKPTELPTVSSSSTSAESDAQAAPAAVPAKAPAAQAQETPSSKNSRFFRL